MGILSGLFGYLVQAGYLAGNPLALRRRRGGVKNSRRATVERYLEHSLWQTVLDFIETLPQETNRECQHYERVRWLFRLLYGPRCVCQKWLRRSPATLRSDEENGGYWWLARGHRRRCAHK
jgi:hypothetical protein